MVKKSGVNMKEIVDMRMRGMRYQDIAKHFGVSDVTVRKHIIKYGTVME